jgi:hypothetical protein
MPTKDTKGIDDAPIFNVALADAIEFPAPRFRGFVAHRNKRPAPSLGAVQNGRLSMMGSRRGRWRSGSEIKGRESGSSVPRGSGSRRINYRDIWGEIGGLCNG